MQAYWLSLGEIATHLDVDPDTTYSRIFRNRTLVHKLGSLWNFLAFEIEPWVQVVYAARKSPRPNPLYGITELLPKTAFPPDQTGRIQ